MQCDFKSRARRKSVNCLEKYPWARGGGAEVRGGGANYREVGLGRRRMSGTGLTGIY